MTPSGPVLTPLEMLDRLVGFPTISRDSNLPLLDWVEEYLAAWGARCRRTWNEEGTKANLLATLGPETPGGVVLSGHTDVVPVEGQEWSSDPFRLTPRGSRVYGRGTADMKGFLAVALALAPDYARAELKRPVHFALSYDEEVGCLGVGRMVEDLAAKLPLPAVAIVGEPTLMEVVRAHKSVNGYRTRVEGEAAHSSQPHRGAGAILSAARFIEELRRIGEERRRAAEERQLGDEGGGSGEHGAAGFGAGFDPPWTTVQVGEIQGGTALNILPAECTFTWEYRTLPGEDPEEIRERMEAFAREAVIPELREFASGAGLETETLAEVPPLLPEDGGAAESLVRSLPGVRAGGTGAVSFATEGGSFQAVGISTVVCGPGSIDQAHRPDEFIEVSELDACAKALRGLIPELAS